ncbi:beta-xylosidase [Saccharopolyspora sp. CA-218241]|uniref:beta-xylosidase n=1 Tax=Saccharopolyspora sp. CA-218241 TaxID=3240027 RepID=UPI003D979804
MGERGRLPVAAVSVLLLTGCAPVTGSPTPEAVPEPVRLSIRDHRESPGVVASGGPAAPYNYGPTVLDAAGRYRVWWCSQLPGAGPAGDDVLHAASDALGGPFTAGGAAAEPVFHGRPGAFDGMHTCDPSVIRVDGRYFLYYTGAAGDHAHGNAIGVATGEDGRFWRRAAGGAPIATAAADVRRSNTYGAGQPAALHLDGWFYLMFTDTTAAGAGWNGAGQFVLRARDGAFTRDVQELTDEGFRPRGSGPRARSVVDAFSADWAWSATLNAFAIAHQTAKGTTITFWDRNFTRHPYEPVLVPGRWREGPGLVRTPEGHLPVSGADPCGTAPIDVLRATEDHAAPTDLRWSGLDVAGFRGCAEPARASAVLDGFGVPSPTRTVEVLRDGAKVRVERRSVAEALTRAVLDERVTAVDELPVAATLAGGAPALRSPGGDVGLLDERGRVWLVPPEAARANGSPVAEVSWSDWEDYPPGGDLRP